MTMLSSWHMMALWTQHQGQGRRRMDADRFDTLARTLTSARSRRSALGSVVAGGVLSAFGLGRGEPQHVAAQGECGDNGELCDLAGQGGLCVVDFEATVQQGPSAGQALVRGGAAGTLRGYLRFSLSGSGNLQNADLLLSDGSSLPVVGQVTGHSFQVRVDFGQGRAVVAVGIGEQPVARCLGRIDGTAVGPGFSDLGAFHALAGVQNIPPSNGNGPPPPPGGSGNASQAGQGNTQGGQGGQGGQGQQGQPGQTGSRTRNDGPSGVQGPSGGSGTSSVQGSSSGSGSTSAAQPLATDTGETGNQPRSGQPNGPQGAPGATGPSGPAGLAGPTGVSGATSASQPLPGTASSGSNGADTAEARQEADDDGGSESGQATDLDVVQTESEQACAPGETRCLADCVDTQRDPLNCGTCGNACINGSTCVAGACTPATTTTTCPTGQTRCSNACVDTASDVFNCGQCDTICALDESCSSGQCLQTDIASDCEAGQTQCDDTCVDLQIDINNCGACGIGCKGGEECVSGTCTPESTAPCPEGQIRCDGICQEPLQNFGSQGLSCPAGGGIPTTCPAGRELCNGACFPVGACQPVECATGWGYCYGVCRDFQSDPGYCGGCSSPCTGNAYCSDGKCLSCSSSLTACGAECVDTQTDLNNCGTCGNLCGTQCINGQCTSVGPSPTCAPGTTRCGNACVDLARDSANCGACGKVCGPNNACFPPGECGLSKAYCEAQGMQACGLGCFYKHDPNHCGGCGFVCPLGRECDPKRQLCYIIGDDPDNGVQPTRMQTLAPDDQQTLAPSGEITCLPGLIDCDGICSDLTTDMRHCGTCGNACGDGSSCEQGQCSTPGSPPDAQTSAPSSDESEPETTEAPAPEEEADTAAIAPEPEPESPAFACQDGLTDCGGVCADLSYDSANCGSCGFVCGSDSTCDLGTCIAAEAPAEAPPPDEIVSEEEPAPEEAAAACVDAGGACDPASPGACCSGTCNDDGSCA